MSTERPVRFGFRNATRAPGHMNIQFFAGRNPGARAGCGEITIREDEWDEMRAALLLAGFDEMPSIATWPARCRHCHREEDALCEHPDDHGMLMLRRPYRVHPAFDGDTQVCIEQVHAFEASRVAV